MRIAIISDEYPRPDLIYGDVFVHARAKQYLKSAEVLVVGHKPTLPSDSRYEYESIPVVITPELGVFQDELIKYNPDVVVVHFMNQAYMNILLSLNKPLLVFIHGYEATSWVRRAMNYNAPGDLPYLFKYIKNNRKQISAMKRFMKAAILRNDIQFVFVSQWIKNAAENDLGISIVRSQVVPNGIDTNLFAYEEKIPNDRLNILLIRSFIARNYANDISVDAIIELSKKSFFEKLNFTIYGEGYLFRPLMNKLKHFSNVEIHNTFIQNNIIPSIHKKHGIFLCPSRLDTQGVSMCEAMASGLVPIASPIGGIPEYATDLISSFQVKTAKQIAEKIEYLYHHSDVFLSMSKQARREIIEKCDLTTTVAREVELINNLKTA